MADSQFQPKLITVLRGGYTGKEFTSDLIAGIIVGIVALPLAIAFAIASGVEPEKGPRPDWRRKYPTGYR